MDFETAYTTYRHEILNLSRQTFLDMEPDDIAAEMTIALWKTTQSYNAELNDSFRAYWWSVWQNRRVTLARRHNRMKRVHADPVAPHSPVLDAPYTPSSWPQPPKGTTRSGTAVWHLLAGGENARDAMALSEVTKRAYYAQIQTWRTAEVRESLR